MPWISVLRIDVIVSLSTLKDFRKELYKKKNPKKSKVYQSFFKTGPGEYGEGDKFIGVTVPDIRATVRRHPHLTITEVSALVKSKIHEERLAGLLMWVAQYQQGDDKAKKQIYSAYMRHRKWVNNWDLVDLSAHHVVGHYLFKRSKKVLYDLSRSKNLWERRISILSTFYDIRQNKFDETLKISRTLLQDDHDLIHKAVGWMLREVGKRDLKAEERFLKRHYQKMPRTMLRYAIEHFPEGRRKAYLRGRIR